MIEKFEIIKYKCFNDFTLEGLSRINIISGKNNVGKTALLEAFYIMEDALSLEELLFEDELIIYPLIYIAQNRGIAEKTFTYYLSSFDFNIKINGYMDFSSRYTSRILLNKLEQTEQKKFNMDYVNFISMTLNDTLGLVPIPEIDFNEYTFYEPNYINSSKPTHKSLVKLYSRIQTAGLQHKFLKYLQILDKNIVWIEPQLIREEMFLRINLKNPEYSLFSSELGEGTNRFIQILATLLTSESKKVFIDEIENGLHYSRLYDIWKAIIEIVRLENVQLFVTTHDNESIEALNQASEDSNFKEITSIKLFKNEENKIVPTIKTYDNFSYGINRGADIR